MKITRSAALLATSALVVGGLTVGAQSAQAAVPAPILSYDFQGLPAAGSSVGASTVIADGSGSHAGTVRGAGATSVAGPRGGSDRALSLPGGGAGSSAAYVQIAPGLLTSASQDITMSAWMKWNGNQACSWAYALGDSTNRYLFTTPNCGGRLIGAVKDGTEQRASDDQAGAIGRWSHVSVVLSSGKSVSTYVDGALQATTPTSVTGAALVGTGDFAGFLGKSFYGPDPYFAGALDDVQVYGQALSEDQIRESIASASGAIAAADAAAATLGDTSAVTTDLTLPRSGSGGSTITWKSSDTDVVSNDGKVRRPAPGQADATVTLTATAAFAGSTAASSPITVTVVAESADALASRVQNELVVAPVVSSGSALPTVRNVDLSWKIDGTAATDGKLVNSGGTDRTVSLEATAKVGTRTVTKTFRVTILSASTGQELVSYTRTPTGEGKANQETVARSLHLAVGADSDTAAALHQNYGVLFARGEWAGEERADLRGLASPSLFTFADGTVGVIATRVFLSGSPDSTASSSAFVWKATDATATDFQDLGPIDLGTTGGVRNPAAVYDSAQKHYLVSWTDSQGTARYVPVTDLARTERVATPFEPEDGGTRPRIVTADNRGEVRTGSPIQIAADDLSGFAGRVADALPASSLPVSASTAKALADRYNRVTNTTVSVGKQTIAQGDTSSLSKVKAQLGYTDGSTATRGIDWNADQLKALQTASPGTYQLTGTVRAPQYATPFAANRADPTIYRYERNGVAKYIFIATDDTNNNNVASSHLPIRVADSIEKLSDASGAREVDLLNRFTRGDTTSEGRKIAGCYWAPEIHEIGGKLSILFAPCFNPNDRNSPYDGAWFTVQAHIMQLKDGGDPANPADWSKPAPVLKSSGNALGNEAFGSNISLDMSYFEAGGSAYYMWSQRYLGNPIGDPATWIAKVDPSNPTRLTSDPKIIISPQTSVEANLAEGAFATFHDGRITLVYSSDGVSPKYVVSGQWADVDADLTDIDSWTKFDAPLQKSVPMPDGVTDYLKYQQGPGHGAFSVDADGNEIYVYHTWGNGVGGDGRDARITRVHYAADDRPILDMSADEEVLPANRAVTTTVTVTGTASATVKATPRCVAGKVVLAVAATNTSPSAATIESTTAFGKKSFGSVAKNTTASASFSTRAASIPAGTVSSTVTVTANGATSTAKVDSPYPALACG